MHLLERNSNSDLSIHTRCFVAQLCQDTDFLLFADLLNQPDIFECDGDDVNGFKILFIRRTEYHKVILTVGIVEVDIYKLLCHSLTPSRTRSRVPRRQM